MQPGDDLEKDLEFVRTNAISFSISNGNKLHYFEHWHTVKIVLTEYDLLRVVGGYEQDFVKRINESFQGEDWKPRTKEGFAAYNKERMAMIVPAPKRTGYGITGLGQIERDKVVCAYVKDPTRSTSDRDDADYQKAFRDVIVSIISVVDEDDAGGSISLFKDDIGDIRPGEDNLHLTLYMPVDRLRDLITEIRSSTPRPRLEVAAIVALYQSEVEAGLRDWHHPQTFLLPGSSGLAPARLMQIRFGFDKPTTLDTLDLPETSTVREELVADTKPQPAQATSTASLKSIKIALWIIAVASVLRLLIR